MTEQAINALTGRELDKAVAEMLDLGDTTGGQGTKENIKQNSQIGIPQYSTDWNALKVVKVAIQARGYGYDVIHVTQESARESAWPSLIRCYLWRPDQTDDGNSSGEENSEEDEWPPRLESPQAFGDTENEALCRAFLKAFAGEEGGD